MARYTTQALVEKILPSNYNLPTTLIDTTQWGVILDESSKEIDTVLRPKYVPFNATTDTPPTPKPIQKIATRLAAVSAIEIVRAGTFNGDFEELYSGWEAWCEKKLDRLAKGLDVLAHETVTSETLSFGSGAEFALDNDEAFLNVLGETDSATDSGEESPTVIVESVRVTVAGLTGYRYGTDFLILFHPEFQKWYIEDLNGQLKDEATPTVTYRWSWERWNQPPLAGRARSGKLQFV